MRFLAIRTVTVFHTADYLRIGLKIGSSFVFVVVIIEAYFSLMRILISVVGTFSWTGLGFKVIDIKSKVLSKFKMDFVLSMQVGALEFERTVIIIITLLLFIG
jgi:hypothetical protein